MLQLNFQMLFTSNDTLKRSNFSISIFLEFSTPFDNVNHGILFDKLERLVIRGGGHK